MSDRLASIVLPVHRQADHIARIIQEYDEVLARARMRYEFVLVVNGAGAAAIACAPAAAL